MSPDTFDKGVRGGIHELFRQGARKWPSRTAIEYEAESLTYQELDRRSDGLAAWLISQGVASGDLLGLCFRRGIDMIVAVLGILKAGAAYVPIDPDSPAARVNYIIDQSRVRVVVADRQSAGLLERADLKVVIYERNTFAGNAPLEWTPSAVAGYAVAYVIYTSGTTGKPHGVVVNHRNVDRLFRETERWFHFAEGDVWTLFHSIAFDFSVWELWGALLYGGKLVVVPSTTTRVPERFYQLVVDRAVTVLNLTPTAFRSFEAIDARRGAALSLRHIILGGEPINKEVAASWLARRGELRPELVNMYGITETTVHVTYRPLSLQLLKASDLSPIGVPIPDLTIRLLNGDGQPVARGEVGEFHVGGPGVSAGYLDDPALTASRFLPLETAGGRKELVYRTGDLGVTHDGVEYFFVGRADDQIKLHGYRIDPREIEAVADAQPGLSGAVVLKVLDAADDAQLVLFCLCDPQTTSVERAAASEAVMTRIRECLPPYMCPSQCILLHEYPKNHHGKVDRESLRPLCQPSQRPPQVGVIDGYPDKVRAIWEEVLRRPVTSPDVDLFDMGGTSLDLIRILTETKNRLSLDIELSSFGDGLSLGLYVKVVGDQLASRTRLSAQGSRSRILNPAS